MARAAADQQRPGSDRGRRGALWLRRATAVLPLLPALVAVARPSSGSTAGFRIPHAVAQTASRIYLPLALRLSEPLPAPSESPTSAVPPSPTLISVGTPTASPLPSDPRPTPPFPTTVPPTTASTATPTPQPWPAEAPGLFGPSGDLVWLWPERGDGGRRYHLGTGRTAYGAALPLIGDWDGDTWDEPGYYDVRAGRVFLAAAHAEGRPLAIAAFGEPWRLAVAGDWDGRGRDGVGLLNPWTLELRLWADATGATPLRVYHLAGIQMAEAATWAEIHWQILAGDWDGDGQDELGLYDPADGSLRLWPGHGAEVSPRRWATDQFARKAVAGDWDGDGRDSVGLYDHQTMTLDLLDPVDPTRSQRWLAMGDASADWQPIAGRWRSDAAAGPATGFPWPTAEAEALGLDPSRLAAAARRAAALPNLRSLLLLRHDRLVLERYWRGADAAQASNLKSVSKSMLSALVGIAIADGKIAGLDERVGRLLPSHFGAAPRNRIRVRDLLDMRAGLAWAETGASLEGMIVSEDWPAYVAAQAVEAAPGERWEYSTGLTHVGAAVLEAAVDQPLRAFAQARLFVPLGIAAPRWDHDPAGLSMGGSELWLRPRDLARFGQLYLRDGVIDGRRILAADWVRASLAPGQPTGEGDEYGLWWWRRSIAGRDVSFAWGYGGQFLFVVPGDDLLVIVTADSSAGNPQETHDGVFSLLAEEILPAVRPSSAARDDVRPARRRMDSFGRPHVAPVGN